MPITFDTLDELKAFYRMFHLQDKDLKKSGRLPDLQVGRTKPGRRGRPAGKTAKSAIKVTGAKRGPKPKTATAAKAPRMAKRGDTLTSKIRNSIQKFLDADQSFTANDIYADLVAQKYSVNKQSVITSVLKQMNSNYKTVKVTERPGNGPRPVKLYNP